jgi:hypothetical protein
LTSSGSSTRGNRRTGRTNAVPRVRRRIDDRVAMPRNTGFTVTSPRATRSPYRPDTLDRRRLIVDSAIPEPPSARRTTLLERGERCSLTNRSTSAVVTSNGSRPTTVKNTFKSYAVANTVFGRHRARTSSK